MKKVKFIANYDSDINIYNSILNCFPLSEEDKNLLTYRDDYEYLGIINGCNRNMQIIKEKTVGFLQEPANNINYDRNLDKYCGSIYCQDKNMFNQYKGIQEHNLCMFYSNHTFYQNDKFNNLSFDNRKKICIFVSSIFHPNNPKWTNHNYLKRHKLIQQILNSDLEIDIYGRGWDIKDERYKGSPINKHEILKNYQYSIAIENVCEQNYISEKFFDCILNDTMPIYYGCPNINDVFDENCYIPLKIENESIIDDLKKIISVDNRNKEAFLDAKQKYFNNFNPLKKIKDLYESKN